MSRKDVIERNQRPLFSVIPVKTGIQRIRGALDSRLRGSDDCASFCDPVWLVSFCSFSALSARSAVKYSEGGSDNG